MEHGTLAILPFMDVRTLDGGA